MVMGRSYDKTKLKNLGFTVWIDCKNSHPSLQWMTILYSQQTAYFMASWNWILQADY